MRGLRCRSGILQACSGFSSGSAMDFRRRLIFGFVAITLLIAIVGGLGTLALGVVSAQKDDVTREFSDDLAQVERLRYTAEQAVAANRAYLLTGDTRYHDRTQFAERRFAEV